MEVETGVSFFSQASGEPASEPNLFFDPEFDSCLKILQKPYSYRNEEENAFIVKKIISLDVFKKSVLDNLNAKTVLTKLTPHMYFEYFPANSVLSEYDSHSEKFSILLQGRAKEFVPKTLQEMEKESDNCSKELKSKKNCGTIQSITELCVPASLTSLGRDDDCNSQIPTMNTLADREYPNSATENSKEKFVKINTVLPSLRRMASPKFKNENLDDGQCKKVLKRMKGTIDVLNLDDVLDANFAQKQIDEQVVAEFKKHENYYLGGILKLKFSRFLCIGDHYGLNLLRGDSVANRAIIATEDCYCLTIPKEDYIRVLENEKELNKDKIEFFQKLFADKFHSRSLAEFALLWDNQIYQMNQTVFHQDDAADTLHVLVSGEVVISKTLDVSIKKAQTSDDLPLKIKKRHDSNEHLLKLVTICAGNFFGEEDFFNGHQRKVTATVSSTRAKVFKLSMQNYGTAHKEYRDIVHEIEGLVRAKKTWEKQRLEYLSQQCEPKQQTPEQFYKKKHQVIQFDHNTSKYSNPDAHPKKLIVFKKEKPVNIRFQYDKFFVPKPEKGYPGYYDVVAEEKSKSLTPHHKVVPPTKGLNFLNLRSEDHENSVEDQKSEFLPSVSQVDMKRSSSEFNRKNHDKNQQQTMKKILDSHLTGARKQMKKQHSDNNFHALTENSLKISTRYLHPEEEYTLRVSNITKNSHDALRLDSDPSLKPFCSNSAQTPVRPLSRAGACPPKNLMSELMHILPLSVRTSVQPCTNLHSSAFHDPLRIVSLNGSGKIKADTRRRYPEAAALLAEKVAKGSVRIVKADVASDQIMKSETTQNKIDNKENGVESEKIGMGLGLRCPTKVTLLTRSKSSFIKKI